MIADALEHIVRLLGVGSNALERVDTVELLFDLEHPRSRLDRVHVGSERKAVDDVAKVVVVA